MSHELCVRIKVGDKMAFKHSSNANVKIQAPFAAKNIIMLVGGTGVAPMIQALHAILGDESKPASVQQVQMVYGSKTSNDILGKDMIDQWASTYSSQFGVTHILSEEPADSDWNGPRGYIDKTILEEMLPPASVGNDVMIFVCGPTPFYNVLCGPREDREKVAGILGELGYQANQVYKF
jgi:cytochrome-b5 reductase